MENEKVNEKNGADSELSETPPAATPQLSSLHDESSENNPESEKDYPGGLKLFVIIAGLCAAVLLVALDNTILVTAIPKITDAFQSIDDIGWYGSGYLLTTCSFQLFYGRLYTMFNVKIVFLAAISIFEVGSLICGVSKNSTTLIVGRAVAGLGAAGILSGSMIIIAHNVPLQKRPVYTGFTLGMYGISSVIGPLLGGVLTDRVSWRWCFYINLPIGAVVLVLIGFFLSMEMPSNQEKLTYWQRFKQLDPIGTMLFVPSIICLLLAVQLGGSTYSWSSGRIIALFVVFAVLLVAFIGVQIWEQEAATVPPRIFMKRSILAGVSYGHCLGGSFFILVYFLPTWFQAIKGTTATMSGVDILPLSFSQMFGVIISGGLTTALGYYTPFMYLGTIFMSVGGGLLYLLKPDSGSNLWIGYQIIFGFGAGFGFQQATIAAQAVLDLADVATGVAINMFTQLLGGAIFVTAAQNVFANKLVSELPKVLPNVNPGMIIATGATELRSLVPASDLPALLSVYNDALVQTFLISTILGALTTVGALAMEWKSVKGKDLSVQA